VRDEGSGSRWRRLTAPGFDEWLTSAAGVRRYTYARTIQNLAAPAAYRTIVRFRWLDADGLALKSARATSAACRQPDMRPDLEPVRVAVAPGPDPVSRRYTVTLRNAGRTDTGPFDVALDDVAEPLAGLAAGAWHTVVFVAPACAPDAPPPTLTLDPADAVDERDEDDNVLAVTCP
jgi:hypothetical protein